MKKSYFKYNLSGGGGVFTLSLMALLMVIGASEPVSGGVPVEALDGLKIQLTRPNVSGAEVLTTDESKSCHYSSDENALNIVLTGLENGTHRLTVKCKYGTNTYVLAVIDCVVSEAGSQGEPIEIELPVVKTVSDGDKSGADATVYAKDGDGNAHITKPLSIGNGVATSGGAVASGRAYEGASIQATGEGAVASGYADGEGASILADAAGAVASGYANGEGASIQATSDGAVASGYADGEGASIQATSEGAVASGGADATNGDVIANGMASQAFGIGTQTQTDGQMVLGKCNVVDTDGDYALIVGNGADNQNRSNAFAIDWNGNLVLFDNGTPVVLTPAKLAALIA